MKFLSERMHSKIIKTKQNKKNQPLTSNLRDDFWLTFVKTLDITWILPAATASYKQAFHHNHK